MNFRYSPRALLFILLIGAVAAWFASPDARMMLTLPMLLCIPGAVFLHVLHFSPTSSWLVRFAVWPGVSVALITILYEWLTVVHIAILPPIPVLLLGLCVFGAIFFVWSQHNVQQHSRVSIMYSIGLILLFLVTLALRFYQIRELVLPAWVDSLHHALLIRVTAETGQAPFSLQPYLPVERLPYHWGYHVVSALAFQAAGSPLPAALPQGMLWHGQLISACMVPAYAGLALYLWRRPCAGVIAGLIVGLLSVMPAYYVSWGRYTLLTGLLVLPAVLVSTHMALRTPSLRSIVVASIALAGLSLVHFVVFVFALIWCLALALVEQPKRWYVLGAIIFSALIMTLPWLIFLIGQVRLGSGASATYIAGNESYNALPFDLLWAGNNQILLVLAGIGALLGFLRKLVNTALVVVWSAFIVLLANPGVIGLPYISFMTNETVVICLFVPCALLIGGGAAIILEWAALRVQHRVVLALTLALTIILAGWGVWTWQSIVRPDTILANHDDLNAITWVADHTPPTARFLVNTVGWLGNVDRGADGGWWLLPLANRQVSTPPVLYTYADDVTVTAIQRTTNWLRNTPSPTDSQLADFMHTHNFTYVYAVVGGQPLDSVRLRNSALFEPLYESGRVMILRLR